MTDEDRRAEIARLSAEYIALDFGAAQSTTAMAVARVDCSGALWHLSSQLAAADTPHEQED